MAKGQTAQAQEVREEAITGQESLELVKCLLRVSIYHVAFLRGLFPDKYFRGVDMHNLDNMHIKMLQEKDDESCMLIDWVEGGVVDAIQRRYLKRLFFGIAEDPQATRLLEEYVFSFSYDERGYVAFQVGTRGKTKFSSEAGNVKYEVCRLMRMLIQITQTLEKVPEDRFLFMKLMYYDHTPQDYEPPHFQEAGESSFATFSRKPFTMEVGRVGTKHHQVSLHVKSVLDTMTLEGEEQMVEDNMTVRAATTGLPSGTTGLPGASEGGGSRCNSMGADEDAGDDNVSGGGYSRAGAYRQGRVEEPAVDGLYTEPQGLEDEQANVAGAAAAIAPTVALQEFEESPASASQVDTELGALRAWLAKRSSAHILDMMARFGNISTPRLERYVTQLVSEGVLAPSSNDPESYAVAQTNASGGAKSAGASAADDFERAMQNLAVSDGGRGKAPARPHTAKRGRAGAAAAAAGPTAPAAAPMSSEQGGVWAAAGTELTQSVMGAAPGRGLRGGSRGAMALAPSQQPMAGLFLENTQPSQAGAGPSRQRKLSMVKEAIKQTGKRRRGGAEGNDADSGAAAPQEQQEQRTNNVRGAGKTRAARARKS